MIPGSEGSLSPVFHSEVGTQRTPSNLSHWTGVNTIVKFLGSIRVLTIIPKDFLPKVKKFTIRETFFKKLLKWTKNSQDFDKMTKNT